MTEDSSLSVSRATYVEWKIRNFCNIRSKVNYSVESPYFSLGEADWFLEIFPKGQSHYKSFGWIGLYLNKEISAKKYRIAFKLGIKTTDGLVVDFFEDEVVFGNDYAIDNGWGTARFIKRSELSAKNAIASDGSLTVVCSARIVNDIFLAEVSTDQKAQMSSAKTVEAASQTSSTVSTLESASQTSSTVSTLENASQTSTVAEQTWKVALESDGISLLSEDLKSLYNSKSCTDITILVQNKEFLAHRSILIARSTVFASMFKYNSEEKSSGKVEIFDCDPESFEQFLLFLYTGKVDGMTSSKAVNLYVTADKYDVEGLKEKCVRCMIRDMSVDSFCDVIHLATMHSDCNLLDAASNFFINNIEAILPTTKWQVLLTENPLLCNELLIKVMKSKN